MKKFTGLSLLSILLLALLGVPRVIGHDLGWLDEGTFINSLFVFIPILIWLAVAVMKKQIYPFRLMLMLGVAFGVMLALTHQVLWTSSFEAQPQLGGNLTDTPAYIRIFVPRIAAVFSSIMTGTIMGVLLGGVAFIIRKLIR